MSEDQDKVNIQKEAFKQAFKELMAEVGVWTIKGLGTAIAGALLYFILTTAGWHK